MNNYISCIVIFKKSNGEIFIRPYKYDYGRRVGDETTMGWKVLQILYENNGNFYRRETYMRIIRDKIENEKKEKNTIKYKIKMKTIKYLSEQLKKLEQPKPEHFYYE